MRTAIYDTAASVLKSWQSGDGKVIMKVQYNPKSKFRHQLMFSFITTAALFLVVWLLPYVTWLYAHCPVQPEHYKSL